MACRVQEFLNELFPLEILVDFDCRLALLRSFLQYPRISKNNNSDLRKLSIFEIKYNHDRAYLSVSNSVK